MLNFAENVTINDVLNPDTTFVKKDISAPQELLQVARFLKKIFFPEFQKF